jgi:hypothetical protein
MAGPKEAKSILHFMLALLPLHMVVRRGERDNSLERVGKRRMVHFEYVATEENKEDVQPMYLSQKKSLQQKRLDIYTTAIIQ